MPRGVGRRVSVQFAFATYMAQVAEVEVSKDGTVRVRRVVCAVDCGTVVNPDTMQAQIQSAIIFGITAALYGEITLKDGRIEQTNFHTYQVLRMNEAPAIDGAWSALHPHRSAAAGLMVMPRHHNAVNGDEKVRALPSERSDDGG